MLLQVHLWDEIYPLLDVLNLYLIQNQRLALTVWQI